MGYQNMGGVLKLESRQENCLKKTTQKHSACHKDAVTGRKKFKKWRIIKSIMKIIQPQANKRKKVVNISFHYTEYQKIRQYLELI